MVVNSLQLCETVETLLVISSSVLLFRTYASIHLRLFSSPQLAHLRWLSPPVNPRNLHLQLCDDLVRLIQIACKHAGR